MIADHIAGGELKRIRDTYGRIDVEGDLRDLGVRAGDGAEAPLRHPRSEDHGDRAAPSVDHGDRAAPSVDHGDDEREDRAPSVDHGDDAGEDSTAVDDDVRLGFTGSGWFGNDPLELVPRAPPGETEHLASSSPSPAARAPSPQWRTTAFAAGDVLIFTSHTFHMSLRNDTANEVRLSADVRWQRASERVDRRYAVGEIGGGRNEVLGAGDDPRLAWGFADSPAWKKSFSRATGSGEEEAAEGGGRGRLREETVLVGIEQLRRVWGL